MTLNPPLHQVETYPHIYNVSAAGWCVLLFSCVTGTLIGYSAWFCRASLSATTFTLIGVVNKFLTILLNVVVWDQHSTPAGIAAVCVCLAAGIFYQQAPKAKAPSEAPGEALEDEESGVKLLDVERGAEGPAPEKTEAETARLESILADAEDPLDAAFNAQLQAHEAALERAAAIAAGRQPAKEVEI